MGIWNEKVTFFSEDSFFEIKRAIIDEVSKKSATSLWEIADAERLISFCSDCEWAVAHTAGRRDGRQKGRESGYYDLHRNLNKTLLHNICRSMFNVQRFNSGPCRRRHRRRHRHRRYWFRCQYWCHHHSWDSCSNYHR